MKKMLLLFTIISLSINISYSQVSWENNILTFPATKKTDIVYNYPTDIYNQAIIYYNKALNTTASNKESAINYYLQAIEIEPQFIQAYDNLGQLFRVSEQYIQAIECYEKSISIYPLGHIAQINLATLYNIQNNSSKALQHYQNVIEIQPESPEGYYGVAKILLDSKSYDSALEYAKKALIRYERKPNTAIGDCYSLIGLIYYYSDNYSQAKKHIRIAKIKYQEYNLEGLFYKTFPNWLLSELSIE